MVSARRLQRKELHNRYWEINRGLKEDWGETGLRCLHSTKHQATGHPQPLTCPGPRSSSLSDGLLDSYVLAPKCPEQRNGPFPSRTAQLCLWYRCTLGYEPAGNAWAGRTGAQKVLEVLQTPCHRPSPPMTSLLSPIPSAPRRPAPRRPVGQGARGRPWGAPGLCRHPTRLLGGRRGKPGETAPAPRAPRPHLSSSWSRLSSRRLERSAMEDERQKRPSLAFALIFAWAI